MRFRMGLQAQYWALLVEQKMQCIYLNLYHMKTEGIDRNINVFLAIASSSSIGAWAIWSEYRIVWSCVIAASQVITATKQFLPFQRRLSALGGVSHDLARLVIAIEHDWFDVSEGVLSSAQTQKKLTAYRTQVVDLTHKHFDKHSLPTDGKLLTLAQEQAASYFKANYGAIISG